MISLNDVLFICIAVMLCLNIFVVFKICGGYLIKRSNKLWQIIIMVVLYSILNILGGYFNHYIIYLIIRQIVLIMFICWRFEGNIWIKLSMASILVSMLEFIWNILISFLSITKMLINPNISSIFGMDISYMLAGISYMGAAVIVYYLFYKNQLIGEEINKKYGKVLFVPICFLLLLSDIICYGISIGISIVSNANGPEEWNLFYNEMLAHLESMVVSLLIMGIVLSLLIGLKRLSKYTLLEQIKNTELTYYQSLLEEHKRQVNIKHDMKNHIISLHSLVVQKEWEKVEYYIQQIYQEGRIEEIEIETGNTVFDAILNIKKQVAESENIFFESEVNISKEINIDEFDFCVLLGNILDNAIEAERILEDIESRYILIKAEIVKRNLIIEVKNRVNSKTEENTFSSQEYGIGLLNVNNIVERNNGIMDIWICDSNFIVSILLQNIVL